MLYVINHWVRDPVERCWNLDSTRLFGTEKAARSFAKDTLGEIAETCYYVNRALNRSNFCELRQQKTSKRVKASVRMGNIHPTVVIVPSVGELGYW